MRKLALLTAAALAVMAISATTASAATEVRDAATGQLCSNVSPAINKASPPVGYRDTGTPTYGGTQPQPYQSGGCTIRVLAVSNAWTSVKEPNGTPKLCAVRYTLHIGPDGWGYADNFVWTDYPGSNPCTSWRTPGSRIVMPRSVAPTIFGTPVYTAIDAATDFNMEMWARDGFGNNHHGYLSLDVYIPTVGQPYYYGTGSQIVKNQQNSGDPWGISHGFRGGVWQRAVEAGSTRITITH
jgi:hypothetical protein